jgi:hypothetical protein
MENRDKILGCNRLLHDLNNNLNIISCCSGLIRSNPNRFKEINKNLRIIVDTAIESGNVVYQIQKTMKELLESFEEKG